MPAVIARVRTQPLDIGPMSVGPFFTYQLEEPLLQLVRRIDAMGELARSQSAVTIECAATFHGPAPDLELDRATVGKLAELRAALLVSLEYRPDPSMASRSVEDVVPQCYFRVSGEFDPQAVSRLLDVIPSSSWRIGDAVGTGRRRARHSNWELKAADPMRPTAVQLAEFRSKIGANAARLIAEAEREGWKIAIEFAWSFRAGLTRMHVDAAGVAVAAELGALLEFDPIQG